MQGGGGSSSYFEGGFWTNLLLDYNVIPKLDDMCLNATALLTAYTTGRRAVVFTTVWAGSQNTGSACGVSIKKTDEILGSPAVRAWRSTKETRRKQTSHCYADWHTIRASKNCTVYHALYHDVVVAWTVTGEKQQMYFISFPSSHFPVRYH